VNTAETVDSLVFALKTKEITPFGSATVVKPEGVVEIVFCRTMKFNTAVSKDPKVEHQKCAEMK
jgi:hypothetical protein